MLLNFLFSLHIVYLEPHQNWTALTSDVLFQGGYFGSKNFRIPAVLFAKDNSLLAINDIRYHHAGDLPAKIGVVCRRKEVGGNWSSAFLVSGAVRNVGDGDPAVVMDRKTGTIFCVWCGDKGYQGGSMSTPDDPAHIYFSRSYDNGVNWEDKIDITHFIFSKLCTNCSEARRTMWRALFVSSGAGLQMRDGRICFALLVLVNMSTPEQQLSRDQNYVLYTDDFGETWDVEPGTPLPNSGANEAKLVELNNGDLMISIRQYYNRKFAYSKTKGADWYQVKTISDLKEPFCNGDIKRYTSVIDGFNKNRLIHTIPFNQSKRTNVSVAISYDEGDTWPYVKSIESYESAYSACDISKDGEIYIYYEKNGRSAYDMVMTKVSLEWLTDGNDHYEKAKLLQWCLNEDNQSELCPEETYRFGYKVFDQYVESYRIYPEEMRYTFVDQFRNFSIDLGLEGLTKASYVNHNESFYISYNGSTSIEREYSYQKINVIATCSQALSMGITLKDSSLLILDANNIDLYIGNGQLKIKSGDKERLYNIDSSNTVTLQNSGIINLYYLESTAKILEGNNFAFKIQSLANTIINVKGSWTKETASLISFENAENTTIYVPPGLEGIFDGSTTMPTTPPEQSTVIPIPTTPSDPDSSEDENDPSQNSSSNIKLVYAIIMLVGGLIVGVVIGVVVVIIIAKKRGIIKVKDENERSIVMQQLNF